MMGLEVLLHKLVGGNDALLMLGAFSLLILLNFATEMYVEIKNKDLRWNDLTRFGKPIVLNALFLLGLEIVMIPAVRVPLAYDIFYTIQMAGWLGVMALYFYGFYKNLKKLGLKANRRVEDAINNLTQNNEEDGK
jgi:hypothetical protein